MRGWRPTHRRRAVAALLLALAAPTFALTVGTTPAEAAATVIPGTVSTAAQNTSTFSVPVPAGIVPTAITGTITQPTLVPGGTISFTVNGRAALTIGSTLYRKVSIPVTAADVVADGTINLTMTTQAAPTTGSTCTPAGDTPASMRRVVLQYTGAETPPTSVASFLPAVATAVYVQIPSGAKDDVITAGLTAVAALAHKYGDDTPVTLDTKAPDATAAGVGVRVVSLVQGRAGEVTAAVTADTGIPTLTLTGQGDELVAAARALSTDNLGLAGSDTTNPSQAPAPRTTSSKRSLAALGTSAVALTGYGSTTQELEVQQDAFGGPVEQMRIHLAGSHTAFAEGSGARLDVRVNGALVGSTTLGTGSSFSLDAAVPSGKLRSVNEIDLVLNATAPDGSVCTPASIPAAEVDLDTTASTISVTKGFGQGEGFQLYPQAFEGTVPIALNSNDRATAAINAAGILAALQRAATTPLEVQLMDPDAFLADKRNGIFIGATAGDATSLDAPLALSADRTLKQAGGSFQVNSQDQFATLESIDRNNRLVLMLGSWKPGGGPADGQLARKVVAYLTDTGWAGLSDDLVIANDANETAFPATSNSLAPHQQTEEKKSYAKWFIVIIAVLLLLLALQVLVAIRRDRRVAAGDDGPEGPAFVEDEEYDEDALGDIDDLDVLEHADDREQPAADEDHVDELEEPEVRDQEPADPPYPPVKKKKRR